MKRTILVAILVLALMPAVAATAGPVIELKETSVDVGEALQGQTVEGIFWIDNPGDADLEIKKVSPG